MSTFYIPNSSGWADNGTMGDSARLRLKVDRTYSSANNRSTLTITVQSYCTRYGLKCGLLANALLTLNGNTVYSGGGTDQTSTGYYVQYQGNSSWANLMDNNTGNVVSWTTTVDHANDGSATFAFGVDFRFWHADPEVYTTFYGVTGSSTVTEPRASTVSASNGTFGTALAITVTRKNTAFKHTVTVKCLGRTETVATKSTTTSLSWTGAVATYAPLLPTAMSTTATIECKTYNGDTLVGTTSVTITMQLPSASVKPSTSIADSDPEGYKSTYGGYVATKSRLTLTLTNTLKYNAGVVSTRIVFDEAVYTASPATVDLPRSGSFLTTAKITDSRGQTSSTASKTITVLAYSAPAISAFSVRRCNQDGTANNSGAYCKVSYSVSVTALNNHNSRALVLKYKKRSASTYTSQSVTISSYSASGDVIFAADTESTYDVRLELTDDFSTTVRNTTLSTAYAFINFGTGSSAGIGIGMVNQHSKVLELAAGWGFRAFAEYVDGSTVSINDLTEPGCYRISISQSNDITYCGFDGMAIVEVMGFLKSGYVTRMMQRITSMVSGEAIVRISTDGTWSFSDPPVSIALNTLVASGTSRTIKLRPWHVYSASVYGKVWIIYSRATDQEPIVRALDAYTSTTTLSCTAGSNCTVVLGNTSSSGYYFGLHSM